MARPRSAAADEETAAAGDGDDSAKEQKEAATLPYEAQSSVDVKNLETGQRVFVNDDQKAAMENAEDSDKYVFEKIEEDGGNVPIADGKPHAWEVHLKADDEAAEAQAKQNEEAGGSYPYGAESPNTEFEEAEAEKAKA